MKEINFNFPSPIEQNSKMDESIQSKKCLSSTSIKISVMALFIIGGMAIGISIGVATAGIGFTAIALGLGLGAVSAIGLFLLAKTALVFNHYVNKKTSYEELSFAARRLKQYFDSNPSWLNKKKIFSDSQNLRYNYIIKESVKKELMSANSSLLVDLSNIDKGEHGFIHDASRFQLSLTTLNHANENERPYIAADILKELYKEMNFLGDQSIITNLKNFAEPKEMDEFLKQEKIDENLKLRLRILIEEILDPNKKDDFKGLMELLSKVYKEENNQMKIASLGSMAAKILCDDTYDPDINKVVQLLIKNYDGLLL